MADTFPDISNLTIPQMLKWCLKNNKRWHEAEDYIKREPAKAEIYAKKVIKGAWPEAEPYIVTESYPIYYYACNTLNRRWPEGEIALLKLGKDCISSYAHLVIKGRWPEGERVILANRLASEASSYAKLVIGGRWAAAERCIAHESFYILNGYVKMLKAALREQKEN